MFRKLTGVTGNNLFFYALSVSVAINAKSKFGLKTFKNSPASATAAGVLSGLGFALAGIIISDYLVKKLVTVPDGLGNLPKEGRIAAILASENFKFIESRKEGPWIETDSKGKLHSISDMESKAWSLFLNFWACNAKVNATASVINSISRNLFAAFCDEKLESEILNPQSKSYLEHLPRLRSYCQSVRGLGAPYSDELEKVVDIVERPQFVEANLALQNGVRVKPTGGEQGAGINGSFFLHNRQGNKIAIFKPSALEVTSFGSRTLTAIFGIKKNTGFVRERLAYLLDKDHFANVPETIIARFPKKHFQRCGIGSFEGSMQQFIPDCISAGEHIHDYYRKANELRQWPSFLAWLDWRQPTQLPPHEIHKIAIFDIRTLNCDRHLGNFLVDQQFKVFPIDHGYSLPGNARQIRFNWMYFPQTKQGFSWNDLDYIKKLNPDEDIKLLQIEYPQIPQQNLFRIKIATLLLQVAASKGLTAFQTAELMEGARGPQLKEENKRGHYFEDEICKKLINGNTIKPDAEITNHLEAAVALYKKTK